MGTRSVPTFDRVRGVIAGATLTITCETPGDRVNTESSPWERGVGTRSVPTAERADPFIKQWDRTNPDGYLVTQYEVEAQSAPTPLSGGASAPTPPSGDASVPTPLSGGASAPTPLSGEEAAPVAPADPAAPADPVASSAPSASSDAPADPAASSE